MTFRDRLYLAISKRLPSWFRYWVCIDAWAKCTSGQWGSTPAPTLTVDEMVRRLDRMKRGP